MKPAIQSKGRVPYGGQWQPKDPLTGMVYAGTTFRQVLAKAVAARKANGIPMGLDFEAEVEQWCCDAHPVECVDVDPGKPRKRKLTLDDIIRGAKVLLKFKLGGSKLVAPEEAERRAAICAACYMNSGWQRPCAVCHELGDLVRSVTGGHKTSKDAKLFACHVCACNLQAAVWLPLETQCVGVTEEQRKEFAYLKESSHCWKQCP